MFHDRALSFRTARSARPASAVSGWTGMVGLAGWAAWLAAACAFGMDGPLAALTGVLAGAVPMVAWAVLVDRVHRRASTGLDWGTPAPWRSTLRVTGVKLVGLWATWGLIAAVYATQRFYWSWGAGGYPFAMACLAYAAPVLVVVSVPYLAVLDRYALAPRDGCYRFGAWLLTLDEPIDWQGIAAHWRGWAVKGFFLAFMLAIVPPGFAEVVHGWRSLGTFDPARWGLWAISVMFALDCAVATAGYLLTLRPLDAQIRSANPLLAGWIAALACYPPFSMMGRGSVLDYTVGTRGADGWTSWFGSHPVLLAGWAAMLVALTGVYAAATCAFGHHFSNLTNRGIVTHGPYAWSRHPAYLAKNLFWWLSVLPVLSNGDWGDAARACVLLGCVSAVYYWRARTEERHLNADPDYRAYSAWASAHAPVPRLVGWAIGRPA